MRIYSSDISYSQEKYCNNFYMGNYLYGSLTLEAEFCVFYNTNKNLEGRQVISHIFKVSVYSVFRERLQASQPGVDL